MDETGSCAGGIKSGKITKKAYPEAKRFPASRSSPGSAMAFNLKQKSLASAVATLSESPALIGGIIEKGFSSCSAPSIPLPQPTVLPFPVARHRSHGPHWDPVQDFVAEDRADDDDDMDVDNDAMDYDPVASLASPIIRKEKKPLDFQRWKELAAAENVAPIKKSRGIKQKVASSEPSVASVSIDIHQKNVELSCCEDVVEGERGNVENNASSLSVKDEIEAENVALLESMSASKIMEAQKEILEKMPSSLVKFFKKRGQGKQHTPSEKEKAPGKPLEATDKLFGSGKMGLLGDWLYSGLHVGVSWKNWSERVERVRAYRFSLEGSILGADASLLDRDGIRTPGQYSADNVVERDFLRTEGDPAALGYTVNEAVALIRSMVPGQRVLALYLLASICNGSLQNLQMTGSMNDNKETKHISKLDDWQAVWAYVLGPEPQIVLSLRLALDDNHDSVVLACGKAILSILSYDANEKYFEVSEKLGNSDYNTCTAPVFRSKPDLNGGYLHGGFWKYNTKPSNVLRPFVEDEGNHTIQDDIVVSGQDVAAGLIRMGVLPRICYILETDPLPTLEDCLVSILVVLARHSPQSAEAIFSCPRLVETVVKIIARQGADEILPSQIKAVSLLKILCVYNGQGCSDLIKRGFFQQAMWHFYRNVQSFAIEQWVRSGKEQCRLFSALMVEQLRLWKVFINRGLCVSYFEDFFPAMCLWLDKPVFQKLIDYDVLSEFTTVTQEAYLVLGALATRLPVLHSKDQLGNHTAKTLNQNMGTWSWRHAIPMVDFASGWLAARSIPYVSSLICAQVDLTKFEMNSCLDSLLWVLSSVLHMLVCLLERIAPNLNNGDVQNFQLPWLPVFVPNLGLEFVKGGFIDFLGNTCPENENYPKHGPSLTRNLCILGHCDTTGSSLSSVSCLRRLVSFIHSIDRTIQGAKLANPPQPCDGFETGRDEKILEEGIVIWAHNDLTAVLSMLVSKASLIYPAHTMEMFCRGGPAPGVGFGWGSLGGGCWSPKFILGQLKSQLILDLIRICPAKQWDHFTSDTDLITGVAASSTLQRIKTVFEVCSVLGPGGRASLEKAFEILFEPATLKYFSLCIDYLVRHSKGLKPFGCITSQDYFIHLSCILRSHFTTRWLTMKKKSSCVVKDSCVQNESQKHNLLETIHEEEELQGGVSSSCDSLFVEWAHQRLPLSDHWFLSALCSSGNINSSSTSVQDDFLDVAKGGLFFLLGLEAMSSFPQNHMLQSPICNVHLAWKLHALSMTLHANMDILEEEKSRNMFNTLQQLYAHQLDELLSSDSESITENGYSRNPMHTFPGNRKHHARVLLEFQKVVSESYPTFVENLVEQFAAISYGDVNFGRQVAVYLLRCVEPAVRLAAWNALSLAYALKLLPPLSSCIGPREAYLEPVEDDEGVLEAYAKSFVSGGLQRAASPESLAFTLVVHHLSGFIFQSNDTKKPNLRNKLVKSILRSFSLQQERVAMLHKFLLNGLESSQDIHRADEITRRLNILTDACQGNSSLLSEVDKIRKSIY